MTKPLLICITPVKNEAWCLHAFLQCADLWADYIIIADQGSTDGSREIALSYPKVILVDNPADDLHEMNMRRPLFDAARKIDGEKILISLDADEIFSANFKETEDWQKVINAKPGEMLIFKWALINIDRKTFTEPDFWFQCGMYDDGTELPKNGYIHTARVPWSHTQGAKEIYIRDFKIIHLIDLYEKRVKSKYKYYQCLTLINEPQKSRLSLYRTYNTINKDERKVISDDLLRAYEKIGISVYDLLKFDDDEVFWQDNRIIQFFKDNGIEYFAGLDIFDKDWLNKINTLTDNNFKDPRKWHHKLLHFYLKITTPIKTTIIIRLIDKIYKICHNHRYAP